MDNWYKKSQYLQKESTISPKWFLIGIIAGTIPLSVGIVNQLLNTNEEQSQKIIESTPELVTEKAKELLKEEPNIIGKTKQPSVIIDINKIIIMESSGNPNAISPVGARGATQIHTEAIWDELVSKMGHPEWSWDKDVFDIEKNIAVGEYNINTNIPRMLNYFNIPDTVETRLAAYNWGIGNLKRSYAEYGDKWINYAPQETQNYISKYIN